MFHVTTSVEAGGDPGFPLRLPKAEAFPTVGGTSGGRGALCRLAAITFDALPYRVNVKTEMWIEGDDFVEVKIGDIRGTVATTARKIKGVLSEYGSKNAELFPTFANIVR